MFNYLLHKHLLFVAYGKMEQMYELQMVEL